MSHLVPQRTILMIAERARRMNRFGHTHYLYLTDLADECAFQDTKYLVGYAEPAIHMTEHHTHVVTFDELKGPMPDYEWYVHELERKLKTAWHEALKRGLVP